MPSKLPVGTAISRGEGGYSSAGIVETLIRKSSLEHRHH